MQKLLEVDKEERSIEKARIERIELPSFSTAKCTDFAVRLGAGLPQNPSFHKAIFENSWRAQDVYQEVAEQASEESRFRILDPVRE